MRENGPWSASAAPMGAMSMQNKVTSKCNDFGIEHAFICTNRYFVLSVFLLCNYFSNHGRYHIGINHDVVAYMKSMMYVVYVYR